MTNAVWPDLVELGKILKVFGQFLSNYLVFGTIVYLLILANILKLLGKFSLF